MSSNQPSRVNGFAGSLRNTYIGVGACAKSGISAPSMGEVRLLPATTQHGTTPRIDDFQAPKPMVGAVRVRSWRPPV
jgi:hypothetical protein